jgi:hypothetical protein
MTESQSDGVNDAIVTSTIEPTLDDSSKITNALYMIFLANFCSSYVHM